MSEDHPAIVNELATSLRRMLLLYEDRVLRRTCDRWEQEARDVLAKLPAPASATVAFAKDMTGNAEERDARPRPCGEAVIVALSPNGAPGSAQGRRHLAGSARPGLKVYLNKEEKTAEG
ncbi:MAG: hypothetical protein FJX25_19360 [Alphaproteobacteria bacterium]|nr:hypothetical protein [Alphaproteobacteria bacterium]